MFVLISWHFPSPAFLTKKLIPLYIPFKVLEMFYLVAAFTLVFGFLFGDAGGHLLIPSKINTNIVPIVPA